MFFEGKVSQLIQIFNSEQRTLLCMATVHYHVNFCEHNIHMSNFNKN